jgi:cyclase
MKITIIKTLLVILAGVLGMAILANAQAPGTTPPPRDFSKVEIKTTKVSSNFYMLEGQGGMGESTMTGALVGPDGVLLVDTQFAELAGKIIAAVRQISSSPIRFVINTHVHTDHTGGNEILGNMGAVIFARDELRTRMANGWNVLTGAHVMPAPAAALPLVTFRGPVTFHIDGEEVEAIPIPRAHTDGDTVVRFHNEDLLMTGDFYRSEGFPNIDRGNGGSLNGTIDGLNATIAMVGPDTKIIPGHGPIVDRSAMVAQRDMILAIRDRVAHLIQQGKTEKEVVAAHLTSDYDAKVPQAALTSDRFVSQIYAELKTAK